MNLALKIIVFLALAAVILLAANSLLKERHPQHVEPRFFTVKKMDIEQSVYGSGVLRCSKRAEILSRVSGKINPDDLFVEEGDPVEASQVLCKMTNDKIQNDFSTAQKDLRFAQEEYQDKKATHAQGGPPSEKELQRLAWELEKQQTSLDALKEKVDSLTVCSPLSGTILKSHLKRDQITLDPQRVYPEGTPLFVVGDLTSLAVYGTILESDRGKVHQDDPAVVQCGKRGWLPAKVASLSLIPASSSEGGRYEIQITFDNPPSGLNEGLTVDFRITVQKKSAVLAVPVEYVEVQGGRHWVNRLQGGTVSRVPIDVGISSDSFYEVTRGLNEGDTIQWHVAAAQ